MWGRFNEKGKNVVMSIVFGSFRQELGCWLIYEQWLIGQKKYCHLRNTHWRHSLYEDNMSQRTPCIRDIWYLVFMKTVLAVGSIMIMSRQIQYLFRKSLVTLSRRVKMFTYTWFDYCVIPLNRLSVSVWYVSKNKESHEMSVYHYSASKSIFSHRPQSMAKHLYMYIICHVPLSYKSVVSNVFL